MVWDCGGIDRSCIGETGMLIRTVLVLIFCLITSVVFAVPSMYDRVITPINGGACLQYQFKTLPEPENCQLNEYYDYVRSHWDANLYQVAHAMNYSDPHTVIWCPQYRVPLLFVSEVFDSCGAKGSSIDLYESPTMPTVTAINILNAYKSGSNYCVSASWTINSSVATGQHRFLRALPDPNTGVAPEINFNLLDQGQVLQWVNQFSWNFNGISGNATYCGPYPNIYVGVSVTDINYGVSPINYKLVHDVVQSPLSLSWQYENAKAIPTVGVNVYDGHYHVQQFTFQRCVDNVCSDVYVGTNRSFRDTSFSVNKSVQYRVIPTYAMGGVDVLRQHNTRTIDASYIAPKAINISALPKTDTALYLNWNVPKSAPVKAPKRYRVYQGSTLLKDDYIDAFQNCKDTAENYCAVLKVKNLVADTAYTFRIVVVDVNDVETEETFNTRTTIAGTVDVWIMQRDLYNSSSGWGFFSTSSTVPPYSPSCPVTSSNIGGNNLLDPNKNVNYSIAPSAYLPLERYYYLSAYDLEGSEVGYSYVIQGYTHSDFAAMKDDMNMVFIGFIRSHNKTDIPKSTNLLPYIYPNYIIDTLYTDPENDCIRKCNYKNSVDGLYVCKYRTVPPAARGSTQYGKGSLAKGRGYHNNGNRAHGIGGIEKRVR